MSPTPIFVQVTGSGTNLDWLGWVLTGFFTLAGVALGYLFNQHAEKRKAERERLQRWDENVLAHTSALITLTKQLRQAASDYHAASQVEIDYMLDQQKRGETIDFPTFARPALNTLTDALDKFNQACDQLSLVAPPLVREVVEKHSQLAIAVMRAETRGDTLTPSNDLAKSSDELARAVRIYFGIEEGKRPS